MSGDTTLSILRRLIDAGQGNLPTAVAEAILAISFSDADQLRLGELAEKSNGGILNSVEAAEYDGYIAAADLLSLWKSKARESLKQRISAA